MASAPALDEQTIVSIRRSLAAAGVGRMDEACRIAGDALNQGGDAAALHALLGSLHLRRGDADAALPHLRQAHSLRPADPMVAFNLVSALAQQGDYLAASQLIPASLGNPDAARRLERLRGFIAQGLEDFEAAVAAYERVVAADSADAESWNNLGNARRGAGDFEGAIAALTRAAELDASAAPIRLNLCNALAAAGRHEDAERELRAMAQAFPDDWRPLRELHAILRAQARDEEALQAIEEASRRSPDDLDLLLAVASQRLALLDNPGAEAAYREVIGKDPSHPLGNLGLAIVFELTNRGYDLAALVEEAQQRQVEASALNFIRAFNHRRAKRFDEGLAALALVPDELETARRAHLSGQLNEGAGKYDDAWQAFERMNELQRSDPSQPEQRGAIFRELIRSRAELATPEWAERWRRSALSDERSDPVFLVGFPRSGTTLLDTFLMGHPRIKVLEEEPTVQKVNAMLPDWAQLPELPDEKIAAARDIYFETVAGLVTLNDGDILVDKNPLLMTSLPLIGRLFPNARVILALRHPCDVVFSCYATNFKLNDGMSSFLRLETAADLYGLSFSYFERVQQLMPLATRVIQYEKLIADTEHELRAICDFLSVEWIEDLLDHQTTALNRGRIKTASYAQVVEPIYSRSAGRWRNYREHLEPILPMLEPWVRKFGYEL